MSRRRSEKTAAEVAAKPLVEHYVLVNGEPVLEPDPGRWEAFTRRWQDHILRRDVFICRPDGRLDEINSCCACAARQRVEGDVVIAIETTFWVWDAPPRWNTKGVIDEGVLWSTSRASALVTHMQAVVALHQASLDKRLPDAWIEQEKSRQEHIDRRFAEGRGRAGAERK